MCLQKTLYWNIFLIMSMLTSVKKKKSNIFQSLTKFKTFHLFIYQIYEYIVPEMSVDWTLWNRKVTWYSWGSSLAATEWNGPVLVLLKVKEHMLTLQITFPLTNYKT